MNSEGQKKKINYGFLYILSNISMPELKKVGQSERHPEIRAAELSMNSGVPTPFEVIFFIEVSDRIEAEKKVHLALSHVRVGGDREFFKASLLYILQAIKECAYDLIPEKSPFRIHLDTFIGILEPDTVLNGICPKCNGKLIPDAFKVHKLCKECGHII